MPFKTVLSLGILLTKTRKRYRVEGNITVAGMADYHRQFQLQGH